MVTPEGRLQNKIKVYCENQHWLCYHCNVGKVRLSDGRFFSTGLPKGFPDMLIIKGDGSVMFCETKVKPRKPTKEQVEFILDLQKRGFVAFVAYSLNEFILNAKKTE